MASVCAITQAFISPSEVDIQGWIETRHLLQIDGSGMFQCRQVPVERLRGILLAASKVVRRDTRIPIRSNNQPRLMVKSPRVI